MGESRKTWQELDMLITELKLSNYKDLRLTPSQFTFYKNILIFVGIPKDDTDEVLPCVNTLLYVKLDEVLVTRDGDVEMEGMETEDEDLSESDEKEESYKMLKWYTLLERDPVMSVDSMGNPNYSKEEELLRERKRLSLHGITSYEFHHESGKMLFAAGNALYWVDVNEIAKGRAKHAMPKFVQTSLSGTRMDAKICQRNPDIISFIFADDIWVANTRTGQELRLTFVRTPGRDECVSAGIPSFVTQEEFDRFTGYWWEPKDAKNPDNTDEIEVHRILYEMVDERMVGKQHIVSTTAGNDTHVETYRYPKAGSQNAKSALRMVQFSVLRSNNEILDGSIIEYELRTDLNKLIPWIEYIVRCEWMSHGQSIWVQVLNRQQNRLALLEIPFSAFKVISSTASRPREEHFKIRLILEETSDVWINLSDIIYFLPSPNANTTKLVWSSEKVGHRHLFLVTVANEGAGSNNGNCLHICDTLSNAQLTEGSWEVATSKIWVDIKRQLIFFNGRRETPLEEHLYVTSYQYGCDVIRLTEPGLFHVTHVDESCQYVVTVSSSVNQLCQVQVSRIPHFYDEVSKTDIGMYLDPIGWLESPKQRTSEMDTQFISYTNKRGFLVHGIVMMKKDIDVNVKHPTILIIYGGPGIQLVTNSQKVLRSNYLSFVSLGYIVLIIDTMGSFHRGIEFEAILKNQMGTVEIEEQVEGLEKISPQCPLIDLDRIAIHGWSYGGYLALMGLAQRPDMFKVAIAGAPVVSWELYDTGYTERYMDLPQNNADGYKNGSVLSYIRKFPRENNRLLIIHGLIDENVHFSHTNLLVSNLVNEGIPYQLQIFPNERHGIRHSTAAQHFEATLLLYLQNNL